VFPPISVSPYLVPLPPGDDKIAVTVVIIIITKSRGSAAGIAIACRLADQVVRVPSACTVKIFYFPISSRQALGPIQSPIQWVPAALSPRIKQQEREADQSPPTGSRKRVSIHPHTHPSTWCSA
jgi:hypothetical protein